MPKRKNTKKIFEDLEIESAEADAPLTETTPAAAEQDAPAPVSHGDEADPAPVEAESPADAEESPEDILEDVRRSLIEDAVHEQEGQSKWWRRIRKGSRKSAPEMEQPQPVEEVDLPQQAMLSIDEEFKTEAGPDDEYEGQLNALIDLLGAEETAAAGPAAAQDESIPEPEKPIDLEELKRQAFHSRPSGENPESFSEVRAIALEGGEEVFVEVESVTADPLEERISAVENALKPYRRYINLAFAFLGLVMAVVAASLLFNAYRGSVAQPEQVVSSLPFPTSVSLPGGWGFNLSRGSLVDGNWNPKGAEWLEGTEVCRWVALPWSRQLEAVVRTLKKDDAIIVGMSNNDKLTYKVYSLEQLSPEEMEKLESNSPCLLVVLAEPGAEKRWVLTSLPE